jgi:uncharacterized protein (TIGR00106 family)
VLIELSIVPLGRDTHLSDDLAPILEIVDESGLPYALTPSGTCIEGEWDELMALVRRCHARALADSPHVFTTIAIEDEGGARDKLRRNIRAIEERVGRPLGRPERRSPPAASTEVNVGFSDGPA